MSLFKNRTVVGVICILLSLVICFGMTPLFNRSVSQKEQIIRVTQPILAGEEITADMVQTVEVGGYHHQEFCHWSVRQAAERRYCFRGGSGFQKTGPDRYSTRT